MKILMVFLLNVFAYLTIRLRPKLFGVDLFKPMIFNFKLSILPLAVLLVNAILFLLLRYISSYFNSGLIDILALLQVTLGFVIWILLLPNSGYLITELNLTHREMDKLEVPLWYDIVSILSFSLSGILNVVINISLLQFMYLILFDPSTIGTKDKTVFYLSALIINLLISVGVYIGRYIRFYSWDILKPKSFIGKLLGYFKEEGKFRDFILFTFFHTLFFLIIFLLFNGDSVFLMKLP